MLPFKKNFATGEPLVVGSLLVLLFLTSSGARGASLREHRLRGSESDTQTENAFQAPNVDMLKALEYIENLRQKTTTDSQQRASSSAGFNGSRMDDAETLRAMLRLASQPYQSKDENKEEEKEEEEETGEDRSEELLQAVLSTLQQTEKASKLASPRAGAAGAGQKSGAHPRVQERHRGITPHRKLPLMFEDEEEEEESKRDEGRAGEEEEEEDEDDGDLGRESPFKRTNENVEEKYTPQNLATLQSVFDELDKLTGMKSVHQRQAEQEKEEAEEEEEGDEDEGNSFNARHTAYNDEEEEREEEEEERADKQEASRGLDYNDGEEQEDAEEEEKEGGESYLLKRADEDDDPDDVANMVDYYLLKVLETTEEEQKRALEEEEEEEQEEEEEKQRAERALYRDSVDPRTIYQLIKISQKYQIPPEDLLDMLKRGETSRQGLKQTQRLSKTSRTGGRLSHLFPKKTYKTPETRFYSSSRLLPIQPKTPEERRTEEILKVLGLSASDDRLPVRKLRPYQSSISRLRTPPAWARQVGYAPVQPRRPPTLFKAKYDEDGGADEDELAAYLAAQMLAKYPKPLYGGAKAANQKRDSAGQSMTDSLEQAVQDYFEQMDSDKSQSESRRSEGEGVDGVDGATQATQGFDSEAMMKLLSYLNPESEDSEADTKGM